MKYLALTVLMALLAFTARAQNVAGGAPVFGVGTSGGGNGGSATNVFLGGAEPGIVTTNGTGNWTITGKVSTGVSNWVLSVSGGGGVTNNDVRDDLNLPYVDIGLSPVRNTNAIYLTSYLGGSTNTTLYRKAHLVYTNATSGLVFWNGSAISTSGDLVITNAAHNNLSSDYAATCIRLGTFPAELPTIAWEDTIGNTLSMQAQWTLGTNNIYATTISADTFNPNRAAFFGADVPSITDGNGFALDGSGIKISINTNSESYKVALNIVNKYANLTEINIENQDGSGNRKGQLVMGPAANGTAFLGSPGLFRIIDPVSAFPHLDHMTINRTNGVTTISNLVVNGTITGNGSGLSNAVDLIAGDGTVVIVTNANKRSYTLTSTGGSGIATNGGTGINNRFTNAVFAGNTGFSNNVTVAGNIDVGGTFNVETVNATNLTVQGNTTIGNLITTNFTILNQWDGSGATNVSATSIKRGTNFVANVTLIDLSKQFAYTNHTANFTITGFTPGTFDTSGTNAMVITRMFTNNSVGAKTITFPSGWIDIGSVGNPVYNTNIGQLGLIVVPNFITNYVWSGK